MSTLDQKPARAEGRKDPWSQLLEKVGKNQDRQAYHALFEHFGPQIKYYAMANGMASHAEELVQEVFVSIWRRSCLYDWRKAAASTWIFTIARNQRIDMLRKMQRTSAEMPVETEDLWQIPGDNENEPVTSLHRLMSERRIRESLSHLPELAVAAFTRPDCGSLVLAGAAVVAPVAPTGAVDAAPRLIVSFDGGAGATGPGTSSSARRTLGAASGSLPA